MIVFTILTWILGSIFIVFFLIAVHELGHFAMGRLLGYRLRYITISWLHILATRHGPLLTSIPMRSWLGGLTGMSPSGGAHIYRNKALMAFGGPMANLLLWALIVGLSPLLFDSSPFSGSGSKGIKDLLWFAARLSLFLGLYNLIPFRTSGGYSSDGRQILLMLGMYKGSEQARAQLEIQFALGEDTRPRNLPAALLGRARSATGQGWAEQVYDHYYHFIYYSDQRAYEQAWEHADFLLEHVNHLPAVYREQMLIDVGCFFVFFHPDPEKAELTWIQLPESQRDFSNPASWKLHAARFFAAKNYKDCLTMAALAQSSLELDAYNYDIFESIKVAAKKQLEERSWQVPALIPYELEEDLYRKSMIGLYTRLMEGQWKPSPKIYLYSAVLLLLSLLLAFGQSFYLMKSGLLLFSALAVYIGAKYAQLRVNTHWVRNSIIHRSEKQEEENLKTGLYWDEKEIIYMNGSDPFFYDWDAFVSAEQQPDYLFFQHTYGGLMIHKLAIPLESYEALAEKTRKVADGLRKNPA